MIHKEMKLKVPLVFVHGCILTYLSILSQKRLSKSFPLYHCYRPKHFGSVLISPYPKTQQDTPYGPSTEFPTKLELVIIFSNIQHSFHARNRSSYSPVTFSIFWHRIFQARLRELKEHRYDTGPRIVKSVQ